MGTGVGGREPGAWGPEPLLRRSWPTTVGVAAAAHKMAASGRRGRLRGPPGCGEGSLASLRPRGPGGRTRAGTGSGKSRLPPPQRAEGRERPFGEAAAAPSPSRRPAGSAGLTAAASGAAPRRAAAAFGPEEAAELEPSPWLATCCQKRGEKSVVGPGPGLRESVGAGVGAEREINGGIQRLLISVFLTRLPCAGLKANKLSTSVRDTEGAQMASMFISTSLRGASKTAP